MIPAKNNTTNSVTRSARGWKSIAALALALSVAACGGDSEAEVSTAVDSSDASTAAAFSDASDIDFGDDSSTWANDGECDDPRFDGPGVHPINLEEDIRRDATDCRELFEAGDIWLK